MKKGLVILLAGPTGIGKTLIGTELAKRCNGEIIGCDSAQIYKRLDIGSAKPSKKILDSIPHHLIDVLDWKQPFTAADFYYSANNAIQDILSRNKTPIVIGGTGFYFRFLLRGLPNSAGKDEEISRKVKEQIEQDNSWKISLERLRKIDPIIANKLSPNDFFRLQRALEVFEITQKPLSSFGFSEVRSDIEFRNIFLTTDRLELFRKIDFRCEEIISNGLIQEVIELEREGFTNEYQSGKAIGYQETLSFLKNVKEVNEKYNPLDKIFLDYLFEYQSHTRQYVRRQFNWFRNEKTFKWIDTKNETIVNSIIEYVEKPTNEVEIILKENLEDKPRTPEEIEKHKQFKNLMKSYKPILRIFDTFQKRKSFLDSIWKSF